MSILLLMGIFLVLLALEVPVAFAMIFSALVFIMTGPVFRTRSSSSA